ncbi:hypothetical protein AAG570_008860 [Ranatra chinensis]|uniref:Uncharacterized protein n=1 Tax=Ranatra chinensis TaxID=642074 RepID=A0ABD0YS41_9HEMI
MYTGGSDDSDDEGTSRNESGSQPQAETAPTEEDDALAAAKLRQMVQISSSPLLAQAELSTSQYDFFKMLDEKINNGPDYHPNCDFDFTMEESKLSRLLQEWQNAKQRALWARSAPNTPAKKLQRFHSLQSNGDLRHKQLQHQLSQAHYCQPQYNPYQYHHQYYQQQQPQPQLAQAQPPQSYHAQYQLSNSVVMYDKARGGYYTELA